ncbi:twin-arginine translocase TatA/TatE family subunit [Streptomyces sp. NP160]|nr:twin-arginine translocase TatA/TatE family subunit [Streptomyces sp. NP160]
MFDNPALLIVLILLVVLLFGAKRLPDAARSIGRSMRIFKSEVKEMKTDDERRGPSSSASDHEGTPSRPLEGRVVDEQRRDQPTQGPTSSYDQQRHTA